MTLNLWKTIKALVDLAALVLVGYAIAEGADPMQAIVIAAVILSGPEVLEWLAWREDYHSDQQTEE